MRLMRLASLLMLYIAALGCTHPITIIPDEIGEHGLLVGQIDTTDMPGATDTDPIIDGITYGYGLRQGYMVIPLASGEHELAKLHSESSTQIGYSSLVGNISSVSTRNFPIKKKFTIEAGKATNIGLIVMQSASGSGASKGVYSLLYLDNTQEMTRFMQDTHPSLYASFQDKSFSLAPGKYLSPDDTNRLRHNLVTQNVRSPRWQKQNRELQYFAGALGTLAQLERNAGGGIITVKLLETNTVANLSHCSFAGTRGACMKSAAEYFWIEQGKVTVQQVPQHIMGNSIHVVKDGRVVLIDNAMNIYTSGDTGRTWALFAGAALAKPLGYESLRPDIKNRFEFHAGRRGYYIFTRDMGADGTTIVYSEYKSGNYIKLALPKSVANILSIHETDAGLFLPPRGFYSTKFHFLPTGKSTWEIREAPQYGCYDIAFGDVGGKHIELACHNNGYWKSENGGLSWIQIFRVHSLFAS